MTSALRYQPKTSHRVLRSVTQLLAWGGIVATPLLGARQRVDAAMLSSWDPAPGWDPPRALLSSDYGAPRAEAIMTSWPWLGGGTGVEILGVPIVDPVAGVVGLTHTLPNAMGALALALPLALALLAGRVFCGWFCPFGTVARIVARALDAFPGFPVHRELPASRPLRYGVLATVVVTGALGSQALLTLTLPHLAISQGVLQLWLQGGGGAILGFVLALVVSGVLFGPTTYCATLCPTGALLSLLGRFRIVRLRIEEPEACGRLCHRCDQTCWLSLTPSSGDAGPDCDNCGRCSIECPHDNLRVGLGHGKKKSLPVLAALFAAALVTPARADPGVRPRLVLDTVVVHEGAEIALGVLDESRVRLSPDSPTLEGGSRVRLSILHGARAPDEKNGKKGMRAHYEGPLVIELVRDGVTTETLSLPAPNSPSSTVNRRLYEGRLKEIVIPGDRLVVAPLASLTTTPVAFVVGSPSRTGDGIGFWLFFAAGLLIHSGALSLALAASTRRREGATSSS
jgi:polyferredoxin